MFAGQRGPLNQSWARQGQIESRNSPREREWVRSQAQHCSLEVGLAGSWATFCPSCARQLELGTSWLAFFLRCGTSSPECLEAWLFSFRWWGGGRHASGPGMIPRTVGKAAGLQGLVGGRQAQQGSLGARADSQIEIRHRHAHHVFTGMLPMAASAPHHPSECRAVGRSGSGSIPEWRASRIAGRVGVPLIQSWLGSRHLGVP